MKLIKTILITVVILSAAVFNACSSTAVQSVHIVSPTPSPPIRITENRKPLDIDIHTNFSVNSTNTLEGNIGGHTDVNSEGIYQVEEVPGENYYLEENFKNNYKFGGNNLFWEAPSYQTYIDIDLTIGGGWAFNAGLSFSKLYSKQYLGGSFGAGYFKETSEGAWRLDFLTTFVTRQTSMEGVYQEPFVLNKTRVVRFFSVSKEKMLQNYCFGFTYNSKNKTFVDMFLTGNLGFEKIFSLSSPINDIEISKTVSYVSVGAGIFKNTFDIGRIILGARLMMFDGETHNIDYFNLFLQFDVLLF